MATLNRKYEINSSDRCAHCGHPACDDDVPFRIYSERRAKWLEEAAKMVFDNPGDDDWTDWVATGYELTRAGE